MNTRVLNLQNLRGQTLLFRCLETGFVTTAPALGRYQRARGIDPARRELVGERPANWIKEVPSTTCEHLGDLLLEVLPGDGSTIGNLSAREALGRAELCDEQITVKPSPRGQTGDQKSGDRNPNARRAVTRQR